MVATCPQSPLLQRSWISSADWDRKQAHLLSLRSALRLGIRHINWCNVHSNGTNGSRFIHQTLSPSLHRRDWLARLYIAMLTVIVKWLSVFPRSLSTLNCRPRCGSHTLLWTWKPLTAVLKLNSELSCLITYHVAVWWIRMGMKIWIRKRINSRSDYSGIGHHWEQRFCPL